MEQPELVMKFLTVLGALLNSRPGKWLRQFYGRLGFWGFCLHEKTSMPIKFLVLGVYLFFFLGGGGVPILFSWALGFSERQQSADKTCVRARGPQNWNPEVFESLL